MDECHKWKKESAWMAANGVDVKEEFSEKVQKVDSILAMLNENKR
jgi:hypothetical protein